MEEDIQHAFNLTSHEMEIIEHPFSCHVLGRTGETVKCTLFKMLGLERAFRVQSEQFEGTPKPRQIFVTQSHVLATRVRAYFTKLSDSLAAAQESRKYPRTFANERSSQNTEASFLFDPDDDVVTRKESLPSRYSLLKDEHFPLFLTYEKLADLLEGDIINNHNEHKTPRGKGRLISDAIFRCDYWPHFPPHLTRNLDPSLVYSEFIGVIEGSEAALSQKTCYLDRRTYEGLSHRTQSVFAQNRSAIYTLFLAYLKRKEQNGDRDVADRTHKLLRAFKTDGVPGTKIDFLYVNEAQDFLLIDAMLLRSLCRNPLGLLWTGDINAIGRYTRFNDLKAFLYRFEERRGGQLVDGQKGSQSELKTFQLSTVNYKSHGNIVRCAHSVIELMAHLWPYAVDSMTQEQCAVDGLKPIFFSSWDTNTIRSEHLLLEYSYFDSPIECGVNQCILVRDENARTELRQQVGDIDMVLTLHECEGLAFDDVLLYKFFEDSPMDLSHWRAVLSLPGSNTSGSSTRAPRFHETRHSGIFSELKLLYIAISMARRNLWIVDFSKKAEPMKSLWTAKDIIQNHVYEPGRHAPLFARSSSRKEWEMSARSLFTDRQYFKAMHAFQRAGLQREVKIAHAHHLREDAKAKQTTNKEAMRANQAALILAAESFLECATSSRGKEQQVFYHNAAECFESASQIFDTVDEAARAASAYEAAEEHDDAVRLYQQHGLRRRATGAPC
ncbi:P-loop containing nucleoside triphosphate hydrolase protein [Coprinopsis sp. MPI-PUGE-AT-0042]|nr:P-loop containing nucleoside triphosphate hydrolase protein [Coprinopsis sp. MPI-PUGE-AT-0042]